jgi:hypothetical protein
MLWDAVRSSVEPLEQRALLSANITVTDINADEPSHSVSVAYHAENGGDIDVATLDANDLVVSGPKQVAVSLVSINGSGPDVTAVYSLAGPDGSWDRNDEGGYGITIPVDQVQVV